MRWRVRAWCSSTPTLRRPLRLSLTRPYSPGLIRSTTASATSAIACLQASPFYPILSTPRATTRGPSSAASSSTQKTRSEEHTSELQSHLNLVCRLLLEKKNQFNNRETAET